MIYQRRALIRNLVFIESLNLTEGGSKHFYSQLALFAPDYDKLQPECFLYNIFWTLSSHQSKKLSSCFFHPLFIPPLFFHFGFCLFIRSELEPFLHLWINPSFVVIHFYILFFCYSTSSLASFCEPKTR